MKAQPGEEVELIDKNRATGRLTGDRRGVTTVEYAVIIGILALAIVASFAMLSGKLLNAMTVLPI